MFRPPKVLKSGFAYFRNRQLIVSWSSVKPNSHLKPSLFGKTYMDLEDCNAIELVLRGDGRTYIMNIQTDSLQPEDLYQAFVYTRGGPYWQTIQVNLSILLSFMLFSLMLISDSYCGLFAHHGRIRAAVPELHECQPAGYGWALHIRPC